MSKYTTELRFICETLAGYNMSQGYGKVNEIIENSWSKIFDFDFPVFDSAYRSVLCQKIIRHYYTREIGFETVGLWKLKLETKMQEIMPYYNKLYETETFKFNPLYDVDYSKSHEGESSGSEDTSGSHTGTIGDVGTHNGTVSDAYSKEGAIEDTYSSEGSDSELNAFSDTPQGALTNVENNTYLTDARKITRGNENEGSNNREYDESGGNTRTYNEATGNTRTFNEGTTGGKEFNNSLEYSEHVIGKTGGKSYAALVMEYRESLLNIDMMIIEELKNLFMLIW